MSVKGEEEASTVAEVLDVTGNSADGDKDVRPRVLTEKEKEELVRVHKDRQRGSLAHVTRWRNKLVNSMTDEDNLHDVKTGFEKYNEVCLSYQNAHTELCEILLSENDLDKEVKRYEEREMSILEFRRQVKDWIKRAENVLTEECNSAASASGHRSRSHKSHKSQKKSVRSEHSTVSARAREKARIAELKIEQSMLKEKQELKMKEDQLRLESEIAKAKAREKIYSEDQAGHMNKYYDDNADTVTRGSATNVPVTTDPSPPVANHATRISDLNHDAPPFTPRQFVTSAPSEPRDHLITTNTLLAALSLPQPEVPKFSGDLTCYRTFINAFDSRVASRSTSCADKLYYLDQHLVGEPKEIISGCFHLDPETGYCEARCLLDKEYGDPYKISMVYISKLNEWSVVKPDDNVGLKRLSLYLTQCYHAMKCLSHLSVLNHPPNMLSVIQKLPFYLQNKWREYASRMRQTSQTIVQFHDLVNFVASASDTANDPVYGKTALSRQTTPRQSMDPSKNANQRGKTKQKSASFATNVTSQSDSKPTHLSCPLCCQKHDLDTCKQFMSKSMEDRRNFLKEKHMCFGCYGFDHMSKGCTQKRKCKVCQKRHPTALHIDGFRLNRPNSYSSPYGSVSTEDKSTCNVAQAVSLLPDNISNNSSPIQNGPDAQSTDHHEVPSSVCTATDINDPVILHAILPVKIHQKGSHNVISTYCFYDNGSSGCFMTDDLYDKLGANGVKTTLRLKTMHGSSCISSTAVKGLIVTDIHGENAIGLPKTYTREEIPVSSRQIPRAEMVQKWHHLQSVASQLPTYQPDIGIGLLIGTNCPAALEPMAVVPAIDFGPFATRLRHGWTVYGPMYASRSSQGDVTCNRIMVQESFSEVMTPASVMRMFELDFNDQITASYPDERGMSIEDVKFLELAERNVAFKDGHYVLPLPFREPDPILPSNKSQVMKRALWQRTKMLKDETYRADYVGFVKKLLDQGYAEQVPNERIITSPGKVWYLPHHGVYHPNKPGKIRVVFDCSAKFQGTSLNDRLLQGPDLANNLVGVLIRFRQDHIAFMADLEAMFYQVRVPESQRCYLRFLWWPDGNLHADTREYQMNVHIFGAVSSPSIANYVLQLIGKRASSTLVTQTILRNFYVDDCLKSICSTDAGKQLIQDLCHTCTAGGFHLTKFTSNSKDIMMSIPREEHSKEMLTRDIDCDDLPITRALGVQWNAENDEFGFSITVRDKPMTRRGILSIMSSVYDPLGFVAPVVLPAKKILQDLCRAKDVDWDDDIPDQYIDRWRRWLSSLPSLQQFSVDRCFKPKDGRGVTSKQLHVFSDASSIAYGCCAYLRFRDENDDFHVAFVAGKARLAPMRYTTIPRLELTAAVTAVRLGCMILRQLDEDLNITYHTDSTTVLRYIQSECRRFPVFVANRIRMIREFSHPSQWRYVSSSLNPADEASRGLSVNDLLSTARWLKGPEFLCREESTWPPPPTLTDENSMDTETITESTNVCIAISDESVATMNHLMEYFSSWYKLCSAIAVYKKVLDVLQNRVCIKKNILPQDSTVNSRVSARDMCDAETIIFRWIHCQSFPAEVKQLTALTSEIEDPRSRVQVISKSSSIYSLDPFLENGVLRVGGRMRHTNLPDSTKNPIILPRKCHITRLIIQQEHIRLGHAGRNHVLSSLRSKYWIIRGNAAVRHILSSCVTCRRLQGPTQIQKMADLPTCRVDDSLPPFSYTGVDYFGPFLIKDGRKQLKRYGVLFTCLTSRAIHIEVANTLETDSFINVLRRFIARRGNVKEIRSDNGTNFVGAYRELKQAMSEMNPDSVQTWLRHVGIDWIFNPPTASHMGGAWERMIRSVRKILNGLLQEHGCRLDGESFHTLLCEVEAIINSRPITNVSGDSRDLEPLTPNHILTMRSTVNVPPPGVFQRQDVYLRRRWRRVQYLANLFWSRWKKQYLLLQQERPKWNTAQRNMKSGDIVLIRDDNTPRNLWSLGLVEETEADNKGFVRAVKLRTQNSQLRRPVNKLVLLVAND